MSTEVIYTAVMKQAEKLAAHRLFKDHLDVGSGHGRLIALFKEKFDTNSSACDYTDTLMKLENQKVDIANLNLGKLPYPDASFDIVTCTEVIEHLEHYREILREIYRVLKPHGVCIFTTPNTLNINSRLRYLWFGFHNLFGPLPIKNMALHTTGGHITPISWFYLAHSLYDADFKNVEVTVDKYQRSSIWKLIFLWLPIQLFGARALRKEIRKYRTVTFENIALVHTMNSLSILLGRTIVVTARKNNGVPS